MKEAAAAVLSAIAYALKQFVLSKEDQAQAKKKKNKEIREYAAHQQRSKERGTQRRRGKGKSRPAYRPETRLNPPGAERDNDHSIG